MVFDEKTPTLARAADETHPSRISVFSQVIETPKKGNCDPLLA